MKLLRIIVIPKIGAQWSAVADYLDYPVEYKQVLREKGQNDPLKCCVELFEDWLSSDRGTSPKSWFKLIETLKQIKDIAVATKQIIQDLSKAGIVTEYN